MKRAVLAAAFCLLLSPSLAADGTRQPLPKPLRDKAEIIAMTALGKDLCTSYEFNSAVVSQMTDAAFPDGDLSDDGMFNHEVWFLDVLLNYVSRVGEEPLCQQIYRMFGPESPLAAFTGPGVVRREK